MSDPVIIQLLATASGDPSPHDGEYLVRYDPHPPPHGTLHTTRDAGKATRFAGHFEAATYWRQSHGLRPDGKPNRPLTAWTCEVRPPWDG